MRRSVFQSGCWKGLWPTIHLVEHHAGRRRCRCAVDGPLADLLGRHHARRAHDRPLHRDVATLAGEQLGHAEVEHLDEVRPPLELTSMTFCGLEIAVDDVAAVAGSGAPPAPAA
jgi:hypothetical protein